GIDHERFSFGLRKSLYNYMHGICFDYDLQDWFDFRIPKTTIPPDFIESALYDEDRLNLKSTAKVVWLGAMPTVSHFTKSRKGLTWEMSSLTFHNKRESFSIETGRSEGEWLVKLLPQLSVDSPKMKTLVEIKNDFEQSGMDDFELF